MLKEKSNIIELLVQKLCLVKKIALEDYKEIGGSVYPLIVTEIDNFFSTHPELAIDDNVGCDKVCRICGGYVPWDYSAKTIKHNINCPLNNDKHQG